MMTNEDKDCEIAINKALIEARDKFYNYLAKKGYEDYIAIDLTAYILDSSYEYTLKKFNHSNLGSFLKPKEIIN